MPKPRKPLERKTPLRARPDSKRGKRTTSSGDTPSKASLPPKKKVGKKPKKTPVQRLESEANKLMGAFIRGEGRCFAQGKVDIQATGPVQNAHIKRRSKSKAIKFSPLNGIPLRAAPHFCFDNDPTRFAVFLNKELPGRMERLEAMSEWAKKNSALFDMAEVLRKHIAWYKGMSDADWWQWHHSGMVDFYKDPIEELMQKLG